MRWRAEEYRVTYRIGDIEERFSFTPADVDQAIEMVARALAGDLPEKLHEHFLRLPVPEMVRQIGLGDMAAVEYFVRRKHRCLTPETTSLIPDVKSRRAVKRLIKTDPSRRDAELRRVWSHMVFALVVTFLDRPAAHDALLIDDRSPEDVARTRTDGMPADLAAHARMMGIRNISSRGDGMDRALVIVGDRSRRINLFSTLYRRDEKTSFFDRRWFGHHKYPAEGWNYVGQEWTMLVSKDARSSSAAINIEHTEGAPPAITVVMGEHRMACTLAHAGYEGGYGTLVWIYSGVGPDGSEWSVNILPENRLLADACRAHQRGEDVPDRFKPMVEALADSMPDCPDETEPTVH
jgi:hypothetical protein